MAAAPPRSADSIHVEHPVWIDCAGTRMLGIVCEPAAQRTALGPAVLIVVGGPQYRVGSHRQFVLLARRLAAAGYLSLRFDYRGMGDSEGAARSFEHIGDDLRAATNYLCTERGARNVVVWGLCDAASAALMYSSTDPRVSGLALLNPWARSEVTLAATHLKHYYMQRLLDRDFWRSLLRGRFDVLGSLDGLRKSVQSVMQRPRGAPESTFQSKMAEGWRRFPGKILLALSGRDLTAKEFLEFTAFHEEWRGLLTRPGVLRVELAEADHTFSSTASQKWLEDTTIHWLATFEQGEQVHALA